VIALVLALAASVACQGRHPAPVDSPPRPVFLVPDSAAVDKGDAQVFTLLERLPDGSSRPVSAIFSATGGTIDPTGRYVAGRSIGNYRVIASTVDGRADTSIVVVTAFHPRPAPAPPVAAAPKAPRRPGALDMVDRDRSGDEAEPEDAAAAAARRRERPNEPPGMKRVSRRPFAAPREDGWLESRTDRFTYELDTLARGGPVVRVGQMRFPPDLEGGSSPAYAQKESLPERLRFKRVYYSFWVKVSPNWYGHRILCKVVYGLISGRAKFFLSLQGEGTESQTLHAHSQGMYSGGSAGAVNFPNNLGGGAFSRGEWHHVEVLLWANTKAIGAADGGLSWWLDGRPVGTSGGVPWVGPGEADTWDAFSWRPVWGAGASYIPADQYMRFRDFYWSGN
jgi:hypothetical protein